MMTLTGRNYTAGTSWFIPGRPSAVGFTVASAGTHLPQASL